MDKIKAARRLVEAATLEAEDQERTAEVRELCAVLQRLWWIGRLYWTGKLRSVGTTKGTPKLLL